MTRIVSFQFCTLMYICTYEMTMKNVDEQLRLMEKKAKEKDRTKQRAKEKRL